MILTSETGCYVFQEVLVADGRPEAEANAVVAQAVAALPSV